jgi:hypothetical protein
MRASDRSSIPQGTLDMLIPQTLAQRQEMHGFKIADAILETSGDILQVEEGSLYPALQRLLIKNTRSSGSFNRHNHVQTHLVLAIPSPRTRRAPAGYRLTWR